MAVEISRTNVVARRTPGRFDWLGRPVAAAIDLLFPPCCVACGSQIEPPFGLVLMCASCDEELAISERFTCPRCACACSEADLPRGNCGACRGRRLRFSAARTVGTYEGALRRAVLQGKHAIHEPLVSALGLRLAEAIRCQPFEAPPELVVPVPMHWLKRFGRKMNPASVVAQALAKGMGLSCSSSLACRRMLRRQATLSPPQRLQNVRGAFRASRWANVAGKRILLVDDVMTTGATAQECSRALLDAGASTIYVATVARSLPEF